MIIGIRAYSVSFLLCLLLGGIGCSEDELTEDIEVEANVDGTQDRSSQDDLGADKMGGSDLTRAVPVDPEGLTRIPTYNTGAGPLFMRLPEKFRVRVDSGYDADMIFIYRQDDPLVAGDLTKAPLAIARLTISDSAMALDSPGTLGRSYRSRVNGVPIEYTYRREQITGEGIYHGYESEMEHFFASKDPSPSLNDLHLHLYVGGTDSLAVRALLESLTSLSFRP